MRRVFNGDMGLVMIVAPEHVNALQAALGEPSWVIGRVAPSDS
jgi:phosphoribosylaminoimidazole (AIR) synthetase